MQWPFPWFCTERFLAYYDAMEKAAMQKYGTAATFYGLTLDRNDEQQEAFIRRNARVSNN